jgi:exodeoxyribonuclease V alpha subunit
MSAVASREMVAGALRNWADRGWLRRLDAALAGLIAELCPSADAAVILAAALVANVEGQGDTCLVLDTLRREPERVLDWPADALDALRFVLARMPDDEAGWRAALAACDAVFVATSPLAVGGGEPLVLSDGRLYLRRYWRYERRIANQVIARSAFVDSIAIASIRSTVELLFDQRTDEEPDWQRVAAAIASRGRFAVVTGGPGTGKTWTAARVLALAFATAADPVQLRVALAAPTGKAAARLKQSIDAAFTSLHERLGDRLPLLTWSARVGPARTLHALLGTRRESRRFLHDAAHPLPVDLLIVDEASMVHVEMMDGDKDQLASVEAGAVLAELCRDADAGRYAPDTVQDVAAATDVDIPEAMRDPHGPRLAQRIVMLRRSERFGGAIGSLARAVNAGRIAEATALLAAGDEALAWSVVPSADAVVAYAVAGHDAYLDALAGRPTSLFAEDHDAWVLRVLRAFDGFRLLCAIRQGAWGVVGLNRAIEQRLVEAGRLAPGDPWYPGRPVMVARNDYDAHVFNGDVGIALPAAPNDPRLRVHFADGSTIRSVGVARLADVETAFALTVHKSQGSEFAHTALVLPPEAMRGLTRELLYTGITRARERFALLTARRETLAEAIAQTTRRSSGIGAMLDAVDPGSKCVDP